MSTRAQLTALLATKVLSGGSDTTALGIREYEQEFIDSAVNKTDDANVPSGYVKVDANGKATFLFDAGSVDLSFNGAGKTFNIPHNLGAVPSSINLFPKNTTDPLVLDYSVTVIDASKITIVFTTAPLTVTATWYYQVFK